MSTKWRRALARLAGGVDEQARVSMALLRWVALGIGVGLLSGVASAALLASLEWATDTRVDHGWIIWFLPLAGLATGCLYHYTGGRAAEGNNLIIDEIHEPDAGVPRRMAPLIFVSTFVTQLFGGSAGREGTGIQLSVSLNDSVARLLPISRDQRRILMIAAMSAGFGAVFGVPLAGAVFGLEVQSIGRVRYEALVPSLTGALVGDLVVRGLGIHHTPTPELAAIDLNVGLLCKIALLGVVFGLVGAVFIVATRAIKSIGARITSWPPARPLIGGVLILGLTVLVGTRQYLGLSIPLATSALDGNETSGSVFALKLLFTVVTLGFGFYGGEVTPLLVIGATLGAALAPVLGIPIALGAAVGYVAVFAGAANVPLACSIMAVELFGGHALEPAAVACVIAYVFSSHRSIYSSQRIAVSKGGLRGLLGHPVRDVGTDEAGTS
jgi:H+/Cl- antiporter ClcA